MSSVADSSDYGDFGSDEEEVQVINELLSQFENEPSLKVTDIEDYENPRGIVLPKSINLTTPAFEATPNRSFKVNSQAEIRDEAKALPEVVSQSPLDRFRKPPKKTLTVTDLVSPSWCELQYYYMLSKHGKKRKTPAMKQGSAVHKALEDEDHRTIEVETVKIEDIWGLRFWNICQGLKILRDTGRTRELEIWGTIGGEIVGGCIDELCFECPDPKYEENLRTTSENDLAIPENQTTITEFLLGRPEKPATREAGAQNREWIYITDVKTRVSPTLPTGSSLRPTVLQLHLYHHMLENLVQGNFSLTALAERCSFDIDETFSDTFLAQLGGLNQDISTSQELKDHPLSSQDSLDVLLQHSNLRTLWDYTLSQFQQTFLSPSGTSLDNQLDPHSSQQSISTIPSSPSQPTRLSPLLTAEYLASNYKHIAGSKKKSIGRKSFQFNPAFLKNYLEDSLQWWRGERDARGVELQEAWKCRSCDYRNDCEWIHERDNAAYQEAIERKKMREIAGLDQHGIKRSQV